MIIGHRGVPEEHQENTMSGFRQAVELGLDGVELDVFLTRDNRLVVFHDTDTERLTGFKGQVEEMTWPELRELDIHPSIDAGDRIIPYQKKEKIALLDDVLEELQGKLLVIIEIKAYQLDFSQRHTGRELAKLIHHMNLYEDVCVTSFNFWPLLWLERTYPNIESGFTYSPDKIRQGGFRHNLMESSLIGKMLGSTFTNMSMTMFDEDTIERIHQKNMAVGAWTVFSHDSKWLGECMGPEEELGHIKNFTERDIDYFITDDPVRLRDIVNSLKHGTTG